MRLRFTIRDLPLLITLAAVGLWQFTMLPTGTITERQAAKIKSGITPKEAEALLGKPQSRHRDSFAGGFWVYRVAGHPFDEEPRYFYVIFDTLRGRVATTLHVHCDSSPM